MIIDKKTNLPGNKFARAYRLPEKDNSTSKHQDELLRHFQQRIGRRFAQSDDAQLQTNDRISLRLNQEQQNPNLKQNAGI